MPLFAPFLCAVIIFIFNLSNAYCDSSDWEQQWIQGAPLNKQPDWFKNNIEDPRSLYEQMNGPSWRNIKDYYDTENNNPTYLGYGWHSADTSSSDDNTSSSNSDYDSDSSSSSSNTEDVTQINVDTFKQELQTYFDEIKDIFNTRRYNNPSAELYKLLQISDRSLWIPNTIEEFKDYDSHYSSTQRYLATHYLNATSNNNQEDASFYLKLGTFLLNDAFFNVNRYQPSDKIFTDPVLYKKMETIFLNTFCKDNT